MDVEKHQLKMLIADSTALIQLNLPNKIPGEFFLKEKPVVIHSTNPIVAFDHFGQSELFL